MRPGSPGGPFGPCSPGRPRTPGGPGGPFLPRRPLFPGTPGLLKFQIILLSYTNFNYLLLTLPNTLVVITLQMCDMKSLTSLVNSD